MATPNGVIMQYFHWYTPADGNLWKQLAENAKILAEAGVTAVWLPPAFKGAGGGLDVGYSAYDLFDLGEFDQKGSVRTKYGTREEYLAAIKAAQDAGLQVYADVVLNHKLGGDEAEKFKATPINPENRNEAIGDLQTIEAFTHFNFPGRNNKYSELKWHWWHFNAVDHNALDDETDAIYLFEGKSFDVNVDLDKGNFDFLLGCNLDIQNPDVQKELFYWGEWFIETTAVDGFRFDASKHVNPQFFLDWLDHVRKHSGRDLFAFGEYWSGNSKALEHFIGATAGNMMLFDVNLHDNFQRAGKEGENFDLQKIFDNTLVKDNPTMAVTFVGSHDTQALQTLEAVVEEWFKPIAYALILLRRDGYPCVFVADYYGAQYKDIGKDGNEYEITVVAHQWLIDKFLSVRKKYAYNDQYDYFDHPNCIGWTRMGKEGEQGGMAVLISNGGDGIKYMETGSPETTYVDIPNI
jgi:alpha-amylase